MLDRFVAVQRWAMQTYPVACIRRFFDLELLDRSFGLAAQVFVALLPIVIVIVSLFSEARSQVIADELIKRYGLVDAASAAVRELFGTSSGQMAISWSALILSLWSAFSLSRRLARVYASIFGVPPLKRAQQMRGVAWIVVQVVMYISVSAVRGYARDYGTIAYVLGLTTLIVIWFACDYLCFVLLVPTVARKVLVASSAVSALCHLGLATWALFYMPSALSSQASQFGPIGVTFSLFTLFLANVVVLLCAPLVVTVWQERRHGVIRRVVPE